MDVEPVITYAFTSYNNKKDFSSINQGRIKFTDEARSLIFSTSLNYTFTKNTSVFVQPEYRIDFMRINTAPEIQDFFNRALFFNIHLGLRFIFD